MTKFVQGCNYIVVVIMALLLFGCAGTDTNTGNDSSEREYDIDATNNSGTIIVNLDSKKDEKLAADIDSKGGSVTPTTRVDAALSQASQGGTSQLTEQGAKAFMEGVESIFDAFEQGGTTNNSTATPSLANGTQTATGTTEPTLPDTGGSEKTLVSETLKYWGRFNGDRATFYAAQTMKFYPVGSVLSAEGCETIVLKKNNGTRYEENGYLVKQSDVAGRGLSFVLPSACKSTVATITYYKEG